MQSDKDIIEQNMKIICVSGHTVDDYNKAITNLIEKSNTEVNIKLIEKKLNECENMLRGKTGSAFNKVHKAKEKVEKNLKIAKKNLETAKENAAQPFIKLAECAVKKKIIEDSQKRAFTKNIKEGYEIKAAKDANLTNEQFYIQLLKKKENWDQCENIYNTYYPQSGGKKKSKPRKSKPRKSKPRKSKPRKSKPKKSKPKKSKAKKSKPKKSKAKKSKAKKSKAKKSKAKKSKAKKSKAKKSKPKKSKPKKSKAKKSKPKKANSKLGCVDLCRNGTASQQKKYCNRNSPPYPASVCADEGKVGMRSTNDGEYYNIKNNRWVKQR